MTIPPLTDHICFSLYAAQQAITRVYQPMLDSIGLTYPQYITMVTLWEQDDVTVGHIGQRLGLETNTLTPLLKRLEGAGLIHRTRDTTDERRMRITLSNAGHALQDTARDIPARFRAATGLSRAETTGLQGWVDELRTSLAQAQTDTAS